MKRNYIILLFFALLANAKVTLSQYAPNLSIPVISSGNPYTLAWAGGFDAVTFLPIDLNGDGIKDLFCFEKTGASNTFHRYSTFINNGTPNVADYHYEPSWADKLPDFLSHWVIAADFNCDGKEDLFTYNYPNGGMKAYRNDFDSTGLKFVLDYAPVQSVYFGFPNYLQVYATSQPALADIDNDGDMDVINFQFTGFNVEYHKNMGMELFSRCDTLILEMVTECWGNFELNAFSNTATLGISCFVKPSFSMPVIDFNQSLHAGSCAIVPDLDGDGDKDMINGDLLGDNLLYLQNGGDPTTANMTSQDSIFPSYDLSVNFKTFPAPYYFDGDNDGAKDLIVTPCTPNSSRNFNNVLFYKNTTNNQTNVFSWQQNDFLVGEMIDVGSGANVAVADIDADGLQDMIAGNFQYVYQTGTNSCRMAYFRNNGTATNPSFELITTDFASISTLGINNVYPAFGDLDTDGDIDMIAGAYDGFLNYFQNDGTGNFTLSIPHMTNSAGNPINMGSYSSPTIIDLNRDGKFDLVVGEKNGNLNYFENIGTSTSFSFSIITSNLGGVDVVKHGYDIYGYSTPYFYDSLGAYKLYVGSLSGYVYRYDNIDGNLAGNFNLVDSMFLYEPITCSVAGGDINADGKVDLLVGNYAGGLKWYSDFTTGISEVQSLNSLISIYPNPATDLLVINSVLGLKGKTQVIITDMLGKQVIKSQILPVLHSSGNPKSQIKMDVSRLNNGIYLCKIICDKSSYTKKFIINR